MKRWLLPLTLAVCLLLTACQKPPVIPEDDPTPAPPVEAPLVLDRLYVEFVVDGRDPDTLLALRADFPEALRSALANQNVTVGDIAVTFGTSGEATEEALQSGEVQLAFLSAADFYPYRSGQIVAVESAAEADLSLGLVVSAVSDDAEADDRFAASLRDALPELTDVLAAYTGEAAAGLYRYDPPLLEQLSELYEQEVAEHEHR